MISKDQIDETMTEIIIGENYGTKKHFLKFGSNHEIGNHYAQLIHKEKVEVENLKSRKRMILSHMKRKKYFEFDHLKNMMKKKYLKGKHRLNILELENFISKSEILYYRSQCSV
jgi:hypothetical protein